MTTYNLIKDKITKQSLNEVVNEIKELKELVKTLSEEITKLQGKK